MSGSILPDLVDLPGEPQAFHPPIRELLTKLLPRAFRHVFHMLGFPVGFTWECERAECAQYETDHTRP